MAKVKLNLRSLTVAEKLELTQQIITAMTGNASFSSPKPSLPSLQATLTAATNAVNACNTAQQLVQQRMSERDAAIKALELALTEEAGYVESVAGGVEAKIQSAGMSVRAPAQQIGALTQVLNLAVSEGDHERTIDLQWDPVRGARVYEVQVSPDPVTSSSWTNDGSHTKSACTVGGLPTGERRWFRVRAVGVAGPGPWSDPATKIVP